MVEAWQLLKGAEFDAKVNSSNNGTQEQFSVFILERIVVFTLNLTISLH